MFARKSVFEFRTQENIADLELALIDYGLEELESVEDEEGVYYIAYGDYKDFGTLNEGFESLKIPLLKASLQRIPTSPITLDEMQMQEIEKLLDRIEEDDDVQAVYTNIQ